jgi:hypothetical protein
MPKLSTFSHQLHCYLKAREEKKTEGQSVKTFLSNLSKSWIEEDAEVNINTCTI